MKKRMSIVLALSMLLSTIPGAFASEEVPGGACGENAAWRIEDSTLYISGTGGMESYKGADATPWYSYAKDIACISVGEGITSIGDCAFEELSAKSAEIGSTVETIGYSAFAFSGLQNISLPEGLKTINGSAFAGSDLTRIDIPNSVTTMAYDIFYKARSLSEVTLSANLSEIPDGTFMGCTSLTSITIPGSVKRIGVSAFSDTGLTSVTISDGVETIDKYAFSSTSLQSVHLPQSVRDITDAFTGLSTIQSFSADANNEYYSSDEQGILYNKDKSVLLQYPVASPETSCTIPDEVKTIGEKSFYGASALSNISFGTGLTEICAYAFQACSGLTHLSFNDALETIGQYAFADIPTIEIILGTNIKEIDYGAFNGASVTVRYKGTESEWENVQKYSSSFPYDATYQFEYGVSRPVTGITLTDASGSEINKKIMWNKRSLQLYASITPSNAINKNVQWKSSDETVATVLNGAVSSLNTGVTVITATTEDGGFEASCTIYVVPAGSSSGNIGNSIVWSFDSDSNTLELFGTGSAGTEPTDRSWTTSKQRAEKIVIHSGIEKIGSYLFSGSTSAKELTLPDTLTEIGSSAFYNCKYIKNVHIPANVSDIAETAFEDCKNIASFSVDSANQSFSADNAGALFNKDQTLLIFYPPAASAATYTIPDSVKALGSNSFWNASELTDVIIPAEINEVDTSCFYNCTALKDVYFKGTEERWSQIYRPYSQNEFYNATKHYNYVEIIPVREIQVTPTQLTLDVGAAAALSATVLPENATDKTIVWQSSNPNVVTVDDNGGITAVSTGTAVIFADSSISGIATSGKCYVTVVNRYGENITWRLEQSSTGGTELIIGGSGAMQPQQSAADYPWFSEKDNISGVSVEQGVTSIGANAFSGYSSLAWVDLPDTLTSIGERAFFGSSLSQIYIPQNVTEIGTLAFYSETLSGIGVNGNNTAFSTGSDGFLYDYQKTRLILCPAGCTQGIINIPDGVQTIGEYAFYGCSAAFDIVSPESLETIGQNAFYSSSLCEMSLPIGIKSIGASAFPSSAVLYYAGTQNDKESISIDGSLDAKMIYNASEFVPIESISLPSDMPDLIIGDTYTPTLEITPPNATNSTIYWKTSDPDIADIDAETGLITAKAEGSAEIIARSTCARIQSTSAYACVFNEITEEGECTETIHWSLSHSGVLTLTGTGAIPDYSKGNESPWDEYYGKIKRVEIGEGITVIGSKTFYYFDNLNYVHIPSSVTEIHSNALSYNKSLCEIDVAPNSTSFVTCDGALLDYNKTTLIQYFANTKDKTSYTAPASVSKICENAFAMCKYLESVTITGATAIGDEAFSSCSALSSVELGDALQSIGNYAFAECALSAIVLPKSLKSIGDYAFANMQSDNFTIYYKGSKAEWSAVNQGEEIGTFDLVYNYGTYIPVEKIVLTAKNIPEFIGINDIIYLSASVTPEDATNTGIIWSSSNEKVAAVDETGAVTCLAAGTATIKAIAADNANISAEYIIKVHTSYECGDNSKLIIDGNTLYVLGEGAMCDYTYSSPVPWSGENIEQVIIQEGITSIGSLTFSNFTNLKHVSIPKSVNSVGQYAFNGCSSLEYIDISNVKTIDDFAFCNCSSLKYIDFSEADSIGRYAFANCKALKFADISGVTSISYGLFSSCTSLKEVNLGKQLKSFDACAFDNTALETVNYGGTEKEWKNVRYSSYLKGNDKLINYADIYCEAFFPKIHIDSTLEKADNSLHVTTEIAGDAKNKQLIVSGYYNGRLVDTVIVEEGSLDAYLNGENFDKVRVMAWDNLSDMTPLSRKNELSAENVWSNN